MNDDDSDESDDIVNEKWFDHGDDDCNVDFDDEETFAQKVAQLKESYFAKTTKTQDEIVEDDDAPIVESTGSMDQYLKAIKKTANK